MKIAGLIIGLLLMLLAGIGVIVCLALPAMTDNRVSFEEAIFGLIPAVLVFLFALLVTVVSAIFFFKGRAQRAKG